MKRADGRSRRLLTVRCFLWLRNKFADALLHFPRRFVCEGDTKNVLRRYPALDHVRDPVSDNARLSGPSAGQNQHRAFQRLDRETLLRVERTEIQHRTQILVHADATSSALPRPSKNLIFNPA